ILKGGDFVTVNVTVANSGPATASNVTPAVQIVPVSGTAGAGACGAPTPPSASVIGNTNQVFTYSCGPVSGDGNLGFAAQGLGQYINTVATVSANTGAPVTSNSILVDSNPPAISFFGQSPPPTPAPAGGHGWNNTNVTITWTCTDAGSGPVSPTVTQLLT